MIKIGVSGAKGRMGQRIIALANDDPQLEVVFGLEKKDHSDLGKTSDGLTISSDLSIIAGCDCLIDFSFHTAVVENISYLVKFKKPAVIGTTGLDEKELEIINQAAKDIPIVFAPNMSVGVNLLFRLLNQASQVLGGYKVDVEEAHHIHKKDAPSGTAKKIAQVVNDQGFNIKFEDIKSIREGEIIGDHKIVFESDVDKIELSHSAKTRDIFVQGSLIAAKWIVGKAPGLYSMDNVLFTKS